MNMVQTSYYQRNQTKLRACQREYARRKRAPGRRKVSKAERQLVEDQYVKKQALMGAEGPSKSSSTSFSQGYTCTLIVRSRSVDPQRTASMAQEEEDAWQSFKEMKSIFQEASPRWWEKDFKSYVDKFIAEHLEWKELFTAIRSLGEEGEERERICLHRLRRLVAGAIQEWELVQQPKHAAACAELDGALVWQGRGVNLRAFRQRYGW